MSKTFDRWGRNDEYPDDPDFECKNCGLPFNRMSAEFSRYMKTGECPECGSKNVGGGGYYG